MVKEAKSAPVYVSYDLEQERHNNTLINLQSSLNEINFKLDQYEIKPPDNFLKFVDEIAVAEAILVIFSENYFKSFYCMYELTRIIQQGGDLTSRVYIIRENDYRLDNENNKKRIRDYWKKLSECGDGERPKELSQYGTSEQIEEIWQTLETIFEQFSTSQAPTPRELIEKRYTDLLNWLDSDDAKNESAKRQYIEDEAFLKEIRLKVQEIVEIPSIMHALKDAFNRPQEDESAITETLCTNETTNLIQLLDNQLKCVCEKLKSHPEYTNSLREALRELVSLQVCFVVNLDWAKNARRNNTGILEIPARSELTGAAASAVVHQAYKQRFTAKSTSVHVVSDSKVKAPAKQISWSDKNNQIAKGLITHIYNHVFPDDPPLKALDDHKGSNVIDDGELKVFNDHLLKKKAHYFLLVPDDEKYSYLNDTELLHTLKKKLGAIIIIKLKTASKSELVIAEDAPLRMAYQRFLSNL